MRRLLLVVTAILLIGGALAGGMLAAHFPFWQRAIAWQRAPAGVPVTLPGSHEAIGAGEGRPLPQGSPPAAVDTAALEALARSTGATALLLGHEGRQALALYADPATEDARLQGGGLVPLLLLPVYAGLATGGQADLLDRPLGRLLEEWSGPDPRGAITPRQLLRHLGGLASPPFRPLNAFSARARLASGPNFDRAALEFTSAWPPGTHVGASPADAQLLALAAQRLSGRRYATLLADYVWAPLGAAAGEGLLDHHRGNLAAHCCIAARATDWLRLGMLFAGGVEGAAGSVVALPAAFAAAVSGSSPVAPDRGLGFALTRAREGHQVLESQSPGRLLVADPVRGRTLLWMGARSLEPGERSALLAAAGW
jgi:hypothetical protein